MHVTFPWSAPVWTPTHTVARLAEKAQLMTVRVQVSPAPVLDQAWEALSQEHRGEGHALFDGGSSLRRCGDGLVDVCSGGEDVLGSLSWTLNQTLVDAVRAADANATLAVVHELPGQGSADS